MTDDQMPMFDEWCIVELCPGQLPLAQPITNQRQLFGAREAWRSHFRTCTHAERYRRRRRT